MNPELRQLMNFLLEYRRDIEALGDKYDDPEYLAWISMLDSTQWPKEGLFVKSRDDEDFRKFRASYKRVSDALENHRWGIMPEGRRMGCQAKFVREYGGVPF